jgi:hypothetical protein
MDKTEWLCASFTREAFCRTKAGQYTEMQGAKEKNFKFVPENGTQELYLGKK